MQNEEVAGPSNAVPEINELVHSWEDLPTCILERIFSFLKPIERSRASVVCHSWAETYESPSLWRSPVLSFSKGNRGSPCFDPVGIVKRFGRYYRNLTILCRNERRRKHKKANRIMSDFFHLMTEEGVQLESFRMPRLMVMSVLSINHMENVSEQMAHFLRTQTGLTTVNFTNGNTHTVPFIEILESLVAENVHHLKMQNSFHYSINLSSPLHFVRFELAISRFKNLRSLWLNYSSLSNSLMDSLAEHLEGHLEELGVLTEKCFEIFESITDDRWIALKTKCPQMLVHFRLEISTLLTIQVIEKRILSPRMPVVSMQYLLLVPWTEADHAIFDLLSNDFAVNLREIQFDVLGRDALNIHTGIKDLVNSCHLLETLSLKVRFPRFEIRRLLDDIFDTLQQRDRGMTSLKKIRMTFRGLDAIHRANRIYLQRTYIPRFSDVGVKLKILMKR